MSRSGSEYDIMKFVNDDESFNPRTFIKEKLIDLLQRMHPDPLTNTIDKDFERDQMMATGILEVELIERIYDLWE